MAQAHQQGIDDSVIEYYDIMLIGSTGMGKSTTADKLLIASEVDSDQGPLTLEDISLWSISDEDFEETKIRTRAKNLVFYNELDNPHHEINEARSSGMYTAQSTSECEVLSNDKTKVRVLDVPGFHDKERDDLDIMRKILHVQAANRMTFRRILYFLPVQGPMVRSSRILLDDLNSLVHYFGTSILNSVVLVATAQVRLCEILAGKPDEEIYPQNDRTQTLKIVHEGLTFAFPEKADIIDINPPLIFLSYLDTCETVLQKVKGTNAAVDRVTLRLDSDICGNCGCKFSVVKEEKVACYTQDGPIPYDESKCHPLFKRRYKWTETLKTVVTFGIYKRNHNEICACCGKSASSSPCTKVGSEFVYKKASYKVDHKNSVEEPLPDEADVGDGIPLESINLAGGQNEDSPVYVAPDQQVHIGIGFATCTGPVNLEHVSVTLESHGQDQPNIKTSSCAPETKGT